MQKNKNEERKMMMKIKSKSWNCLKEMPPLYNTLPNEKYDLKKSEIINLIIKHPELLSWIVSKAKYDGLIVFDKSTGKYQGCDYDD